MTRFDIFMIFTSGAAFGWLMRMLYVVVIDAYEDRDIPESPTKSAGLSGVIKK